MRSSPSWDMEMKGNKIPAVRAARAKTQSTAALRLLWIVCQRGLREVPQWGQEGRKVLGEGGEKDLPQRRQRFVVCGVLFVVAVWLGAMLDMSHPLIAPKAAKQLFL